MRVVPKKKLESVGTPGHKDRGTGSWIMDPGSWILLVGPGRSPGQSIGAWPSKCPLLRPRNLKARAVQKATGAGPLGHPWLKLEMGPSGHARSLLKWATRPGQKQNVPLACVYLSLIWASLNGPQKTKEKEERPAVVSQQCPRVGVTAVTLRSGLQWRPPNVVWKPRSAAIGVVG
jgi:hypothetical protein